MSTKRIVIGSIGGQADTRIARQGYTADVDDPNDRKKISFWALRGSFGQVAEVGLLGAPDIFVGLAGAYPNGTPPAIFTLVRGAQQILGPPVQYQNAQADNVRATAYCLVVDNNRVMATSPTKARQPFQTADRFNYMVVK